MEYLDPQQAETNLRIGKALEQWLGRQVNGGETVLRWVRVERSDERVDR